MDAETVTIDLPVGLYIELQRLAQEEETQPVTLLAQLIQEAKQRRAWLKDLAALRQQIQADGGLLQVGATREEVVEQMRRTRREIFGAEYAHLY